MYEVVHDSNTVCIVCIVCMYMYEVVQDSNTTVCIAVPGDNCSGEQDAQVVDGLVEGNSWEGEPVCYIQTQGGGNTSNEHLHHKYTFNMFNI